MKTKPRPFGDNTDSRGERPTIEELQAESEARDRGPTKQQIDARDQCQWCGHPRPRHHGKPVTRKKARQRQRQLDNLLDELAEARVLVTHLYERRDHYKHLYHEAAYRPPTKARTVGSGTKEDPWRAAGFDAAESARLDWLIRYCKTRGWLDTSRGQIDEAMGDLGSTPSARLAAFAARHERAPDNCDMEELLDRGPPRP